MCEHKLVTVYKDDTHTEISHFRCVRCGEKIELPIGYNKAIGNVSGYMDKTKDFRAYDGALMLCIVFDLPKEITMHDLIEFRKRKFNEG